MPEPRSGGGRSRPYSQKLTKDLDALFRRSGDDIEVLESLAHELSFRERPKARQLKRDVDRAIEKAKRGNIPPPSQLIPAKPDPSRNRATNTRPIAPPSEDESLPPGDAGSRVITPSLGGGPAIASPTEEIVRKTRPPVANKPQDILAAWTALEVLSPASFRRWRDLETGPYRRLLKLDAGPLPWTGEVKAAPGRRAVFEVFLGTIELDPAIQALLRVFSDSRPDSPSAKGQAIVASVIVDKNGVVLEDEEAVNVSSFAWGVPIALSGDLVALGEWPTVQRKLVRDLREKLVRHDPKGDQQPLSREDIERAFSFLVSELKLDQVAVIPPEFILKRLEYFAARQPPEPSFLNSFFLADLERARDLFSAGSAPETLRGFLGQSRPTKSANLLDDNDALRELLRPGKTPLGRWPAPGGHPLVTLQQAAVNATFEMETGGEILAVNGPPGTGKTTLLRDVIVARIVERAEVMAGFADPEKAFRNSGTHRTVNKAKVDIFRVSDTLRGFEMVVASSNNKAVENVSAELPGLDAIADDSGTPRYLSSISDHVLGHETWGMIAAVLGNSANRFAFFDAFWRDEERGLATFLNRAVGLPQVRLIKQPDGTVKEEVREVVTREKPAENRAEARRRWKAARSDFLDALLIARERQARLDGLHEALVDPGATAEELAGARYELGSCEKQREEWATRGVACRTEFDRLAGELEDHAKLRARHQVGRPGFVARLFRTRAWSAWAMSGRELEDKGRRLVADQNRTQSDLRETRRAVEGLEGKLRKLLPEVAELERRLQELKARQAMLAQHDATVPDADFFEAPSKDRQTASLWYSPEAQREREEVFRRAMALHRAFVEAAADPIRQNLSVFFKQNFASRSLGAAGDDLLEELWATFFLVVPVVSTTFASVDRMLRNISPAALGWLLIDEAGQALPQAAVGALMRSKRAVVVGDPLQIEPVVTLPDTLTSEICAQFGVCGETYNAPMASAQTLADRASPYCARFPTDAGYRDVGAPLLVHRRCDSPMFEISNSAAYSGLMVQAKPAPSDTPLLGPSKWIHVSGGRIREKWSEDEGRATIELLHALKAAGGEPDLYVVTPFVIVQNEMRNLIVQDGVLQGWVGSPQSWVNEHVGTVHTVQGREAAVVIFVLGAPDARQAGARGWAGGRPNILNVAVTRAKSCLYIVGNRDLWRTHGVFQILDQLIQ